ncbi:forkhead box protein P2 isoform X4 [Octopus bimaculoides]|uniref:forkhead box protein P2 isoform X4 n=1 Tax=Octopus bimaculoides TaxID=37653 RepID=UPI0022E5C7BA|nr:forkhead box protein P2 isoform X4 [Octopus bimaculoides]
MDEENSHCEEDGMMEGGSHQETAINLSTSKDLLQSCNGDLYTVARSSAALHAAENGDASQGQVQALAPHLSIKSPVTGAAKRKSKSLIDNSSSAVALQQQLAQVQAQVQQHQQQQQQQQQQAAVAAAAAAVQQTPLIMLAAQQGLNPQQMQQLLQQQLLNPNQLQQVMQQQTLLLQQQQQQKLQEQLLHQLNEQLQLNILQQSQLLQQQQQQQQQPQQNVSGVQSGPLHSSVTPSEKSKSSKQMKQRMHELSIQQQQLIQQIQFQQRQFLLSQGIGLVQPFGVPQTAMSPAEIQQLWKEVASQSGIDGSVDSKNHLNGMATLATSVAQAAAVAAASVTSASMNPLLQTSSYLTNGIPDGYLLSGGLGGSLLNQSAVNIKQEHEASSPSHPLFRHGVCKWPGCDTPNEDFPSFIKHLNSEHQLDDRSTAQARVQMQVVSQLEIQLIREKDLLQAMMQHLHMKPQVDKSDIILPVLPKQQHQQQQQQQTQQALQQAHMDITSQLPSMPPLSNASNVPLLTSTPAMSLSPTTTCTSPQMVISTAHSAQSPVQQSPQHQQQASSSVGPIRRRVSDKCNLPISAGMQRDMENAFLSFVEIQRNREFYRTTDVRPPFTYASLIRQAIIESPHRQLTLSEIYQWFANTFAYFRRNEATWKNAIRTNLSLHKCFVRYEDDFGSFWMVDDFEFVRRRHLTRGRPRKYHESDTAAQNLSMKSSNLNQDPSLFGDNLNASLRAALGENNLSLIANGQLSAGGVDGVEDLSMKSQGSHLGNLNTESISEEELLLSIKQEPPCEIESNGMNHSSSLLRPSELAMLSSPAETGLMSSSETPTMVGGALKSSLMVGGASKSSVMCNHASDHSDMSPSIMCPTSNPSLLCSTADGPSSMCSVSSETAAMNQTSDPCPSPTDSVATTEAKDSAIDFSMVDEAPPPPPPPRPTSSSPPPPSPVSASDRLESNVRNPSSSASHLASHSPDA